MCLPRLPAKRCKVVVPRALVATPSLTCLREGRTNYRYLPGYADYEAAYVYQAKTLDAAVLAKGLGFDNEDAAAATDVSAGYLLEAASWYRSRLEFGLAWPDDLMNSWVDGLMG